MIDYYGEEADYIHLKFGDMHKAYNFTEEFRKKHPKFCEEYEKYWQGDPTCQFRDPLEIVNYVDYWHIPVHFYFNYTDTPATDNKEVQQYLVRERLPRNYGNYASGKMTGWDGEEEIEDEDFLTNAGVYNAINGALKYLGFKESDGGDTSDGGIESAWKHKSGYKVKVTQYGVDVKE